MAVATHAGHSNRDVVTNVGIKLCCIQVAGGKLLVQLAVLGLVEVQAVEVAHVVGALEDVLGPVGSLRQGEGQEQYSSGRSIVIVLMTIGWGGEDLDENRVGVD